MNLHHDKNTFEKLIRETSDNLSIPAVFIEKDYWITLILKNLSESKFSDNVVFKGGTSLSKAYGLIQRFSEDIDIAILDTENLAGNQIKNILRNVEKSITNDLTEITDPDITSKCSRYRKSIYKYPLLTESKISASISDKLLIEINSFANPYPFVKKSIMSIIADFLKNAHADDLIRTYELEGFNLNVLDYRRTIVEKLVSLIRFAFSADPTESLKSRIRHFYDLYHLMGDIECQSYVQSKKFVKDFTALLDNDRASFDEPTGWTDKEINVSPLLIDFENIWAGLKSTYQNELSVLAYTEIPDEKEVAKRFMQIATHLK